MLSSLNVMDVNKITERHLKTFLDIVHDALMITLPGAATLQAWMKGNI
jgi:hypothetical protein